MKTMHIHIAVNDLLESIGFYSSVFDAAPTIEREDYVKWDLNNPKVNFAISLAGGLCGMNHIGMQVETEPELQEIAQRMQAADIKYTQQENTSCCHSRSNKHWALDPQGVVWETFYLLESIPIFGNHHNTCLEASLVDGIPLGLSQASNNESQCCMTNDGCTIGCCI